MPSTVANIQESATAPASLAPLSTDFARQQYSKQFNNNYHSSSLATMFPNNVNHTSLHPGGVEYVIPVPGRGGMLQDVCFPGHY